ncbi:hypothetical protein AXW67_37705 [Bradyrhizobium neotropicale]|uniref:Uncharacterized protein n=1 Tax=Bradyrhizobium neotropicale TaxID=1497615 RepID=A0A176ZH15_9BRAD|nr:hypothetical protein AXW67_37705 [Bradyrhizobium neotropicale]
MARKCFEAAKQMVGIESLYRVLCAERSHQRAFIRWSVGGPIETIVELADRGFAGSCLDQPPAGSSIPVMGPVPSPLPRTYRRRAMGSRAESDSFVGGFWRKGC